MLQRTLDRMGASDPSAPFLPLSFRLYASFGLLVLHLALPVDGRASGPGESFYLGALLTLLLEAIWESGRGLRAMGRLFPTPRLAWIRWNLTLDLILVTLVIAFQGITQERFSTLYIFPVLASAFYLGTLEIVWVGVLSSLAHLVIVLGFALGIFPPFGLSGEIQEEFTRLPFLLGMASLQVFTATLVVVLIRRNLERLRTDLRESEATVGELSALHRRVVESLASGLITQDLEGQVTSANPAAEEILGKPVPTGVALRDLLPFDEELPIHQGREHRFEWLYLHPVTGQRILGGHLASLRGASGRESGRLLLFQDLTNLKALEERTRISERLAAIGQLAAGLAHELRNPLASISGCVQILQNGDSPAEVHGRVLGILERETHRVGAIVSDFLDFARPTAAPAEWLFLPRVVEEVRSSWEMDPRTGGVTLQVGRIPEIQLCADPTGLHRLLMNLLSNARKAVKGTAEPQVHLTVQQTDQSLVLRVTDNGCGMPRLQLEQLFVPFVGGFEEGTGLGMSLVYKFTEAMGWQIRVTSEVGRGTSVEISTPLGPKEVSVAPGAGQA